MPTPSGSLNFKYHRTTLWTRPSGSDEPRPSTELYLKAPNIVKKQTKSNLMSPQCIKNMETRRSTSCCSFLNGVVWLSDMETELGAHQVAPSVGLRNKYPTKETRFANASPLTRMQNFEETPQITTVMAHRNTTAKVLKEGQGCKECSKKEEREMEEFEAFKRFKAMKKRQVERSSHKV
ncbi:unnamed protein product [Lactuca virosa]|uniref:TPX2 C-terminal domain-containing protein n=1 Tax=Lactuca virosa TaxID=75947 RepID=A0AAU9PUJ1_9ASTR|nr:unnamed protein product [Lactuca virosa]